MKSILILLMALSLYADTYLDISNKIIKDFNYIFQKRTWSGGSTFVTETTFRYNFKSISPYEVEITKSIDGACSGEPFLLDIRLEYDVFLEEDNKCDPALILSYETDIIYLYVKDRCGNFGGYNLYKRAKDARLLLQMHLREARELGEE